MSGSAKVIENMYAWKELKIAGLEGLGRVAGANMQNYARSTARWQNHTGNARAGLNGGFVWDNKNAIVFIAHSMSYGVFLELCNSGKYAILEETRDKFKSEVYQQADRMMKL
jgi:hypothetical protein